MLYYVLEDMSVVLSYLEGFHLNFTFFPKWTHSALPHAAELKEDRQI